MKPLVIYHADCADGFGAAFAAWCRLGDEAEYVPMKYGKLDMECVDCSIKERDVYILDFSFPKEVMESLFTHAKRVVWLDHHKTAFEMWGNKAPDLFFTKYEPTPGTRYSNENYILLDDCKSGALLAWEYFHPNDAPPMLLRHIDDYDRWQFQMRGTKAINKALWSHAPWKFEQWNELAHDDNYGSLYCEGLAILRAHEQQVQSTVEQFARPCAIRQPTKTPSYDPLPDRKWFSLRKDHLEYQTTFFAEGLAANCPPHLTSDVGHLLAIQSKTFGLLWYLDKDNRCKCSLCSNGDYDVSGLAKAFGGGGHRNAAGFEVPITTLLEWIK